MVETVTALVQEVTVIAPKRRYMLLKSSFPRIWQPLWAIVLTLAVAMVWPSSASQPGPAHLADQATQHLTLHQHGSRAGHMQSRHDAGHADMRPDCGPSGLGCCMMTLCHPGVSAPPVEIVLFALKDENQPNAAANAGGSDPDIVLPPPRPLLM